MHIENAYWWCILIMVNYQIFVTSRCIYCLLRHTLCGRWLLSRRGSLPPQQGEEASACPSPRWENRSLPRRSRRSPWLGWQSAVQRWLAVGGSGGSLPLPVVQPKALSSPPSPPPISCTKLPRALHLLCICHIWTIEIYRVYSALWCTPMTMLSSSKSFTSLVRTPDSRGESWAVVWGT